MGSQLKTEEKQGNTVHAKGKERGCSEHINFRTYNSTSAFYELNQ